MRRLSLLLASAMLAGAAHAGNIELARDMLQELVGLASVHAKGSTSAAQAMAKRFLDAGFAREDVQLLAPEAHPNKANLVVRLRGQGKDKPLLYLGHLDVVEAKPEDWNFNPFVLTEQDGWLYGRGVIDMLGQDAAMAAALIRLKQEGYLAQRDIILALTADEEAGGDANGVNWLLQQHRPLIDAALVINPDAGEAAQKHGRSLYVSVESSEKVYMSFQLEVTDKGGHSSRPTRANPIYRLSRDLNKLADYAFPLHLNDTTRQYFAGRAKLVAGQASADLLAVSRPNPSKAVLARLSSDVETNIMLRTTCVATEIEGGPCRERPATTGPRHPAVPRNSGRIRGPDPADPAKSHWRPDCPDHPGARNHSQPGIAAQRRHHGAGPPRGRQHVARCGGDPEHGGRRQRQHLHPQRRHADLRRGCHVR